MTATPSHGHAPIPMRRRVTCVEDIEARGDFWWAADHSAIWIGVPCNETGYVPIRIPVTLAPKVPQCWEWNGVEDKPTLSPSIHRIGTWHGFVRDGQLIEA